MREPELIFVEGKHYSWDGQVFSDKNKAKTQARRYLRRGYQVHMALKNDHYYLYTWRAWPLKPTAPKNRQNEEAVGA